MNALRGNPYGFGAPLGFGASAQPAPDPLQVLPYQHNPTAEGPLAQPLPYQHNPGATGPVLQTLPYRPGAPTEAPARAQTAQPSWGINFDAVEQQYGLPSGYLGRTAWIESRGNPSARNPNSSAAGLFQFIDSTAAQYGLSDPMNPTASTDAAARLARDNAAHLRRVLGRDPTAAELYLAHQQGAGGAARLLSNPSAPAASIVGADAVRLNGGREDMTAGEFANLWLGKFDGGSQVASLPSGGASGAPQAPAGPPVAFATLAQQFAAQQGSQAPAAASAPQGPAPVSFAMPMTQSSNALRTFAAAVRERRA